LLSENQLCKQYKISRSSVRKALDLLVQEGLIAKRYYIDYCMLQVIAAFRREFPHVASHLNSEAFARGKAEMVLTTAFEAAEWLKRGLDIEPRIAPFPFAQSPSPLLIANALMAPKAGAHADLAQQFVRVALGREMQADVFREQRFLSVLSKVNESVWGAEPLRSMGLDGESLTEGYFIHDLLGDSAKVSKLEHEMELFWAGLESADSFAKRYLDIMRG
jgi:multiple sugar transport system substrate-binding protein